MPTSPKTLKRFQASVRHYHRANTSQPITPEQWVNGRARGRNPKLWVRVTGIVLGIGVIAAVIAGLVIELSA